MHNFSIDLGVSDIRRQIDQLSERLDSLPPGNLVCSHDGKYFRYFYSHNGTQHYIPKKDHALASQLALKKYLNACIEDYKNEIKILSMFGDSGIQSLPHVQELLQDEGISRLLTADLINSETTVISEELQNWMWEEYPCNRSHPESLIHRGISGKRLRSKSEILIDMILCQMHIPYRYESRLVLDGVTLYPDFTLRHPITGSYAYWEHFGRMDDREYAAGYHQKMNIYISNGIVPTINLLTTYETEKNPMTIEKARRTLLAWLES